MAQNSSHYASVIPVSCKTLIHQMAFAVHLLIRSFHRFTNLLDHSELIESLGLRARVPHGPLNDSVRCNPA
jgi:hypothetical protein